MPVVQAAWTETFCSELVDHETVGTGEENGLFGSHWSHLRACDDVLGRIVDLVVEILNLFWRPVLRVAQRRGLLAIFSDAEAITELAEGPVHVARCA